jgi:hypothetical protein
MGGARNGWVAWDAECSCGWGSHTGGAIRERVLEDVEDHKRTVGGILIPNRWSR